MVCCSERIGNDKEKEARIRQKKFLMEWRQWKQSNAMKYNTISEEITRRTIFLSNIKKIDQLNSERKSEEDAFFKVNKFADMTEGEIRMRMGKRSFDDVMMRQMGLSEDELKEMRKGRTLKGKKTYKLPVPSGDVPKQYSACIQKQLFSSYDPNAVDLCGSFAFDQGNCGNCYAVANAHELQVKYANLTYHRNKKAEIVMFSSQQLMDCVVNGYYCEGGYTELPLMYSHYVSTESDYPYKNQHDTSTKHQCIKGKKTPIMTTFTIFDNAEHIEILKRILYHYGSFVTCIYAPEEWAHYDSGIYSYNCKQGVTTNHVVEVVGYGEEKGKQYIVVRNSWGSNWGISGFIKISANSLCGIGGDDGGTYPVSLIQHADFSDKTNGPYGKQTVAEEVKKQLYGGDDKFDVYDKYTYDTATSGFDEDGYYEFTFADFGIALIGFGIICWIVFAIVIVLFVIINSFKRS